MVRKLKACSRADSRGGKLGTIAAALPLQSTSLRNLLPHVSTVDGVTVIGQCSPGPNQLKKCDGACVNFP